MIVAKVGCGVTGNTFVSGPGGLRHLQAHWGTANGDMEPGRNIPRNHADTRYRCAADTDRFSDVEPGTFLPYEIAVATQNGLDRTRHVYFGGRQPTVRIQTKIGLTLEGALNHSVWALTKQGAGWVRLDDLRYGQQVAVRHGEELWSSHPYRENHRATFNCGQYLAYALNGFNNPWKPAAVLPPGRHYSFIALGYCRRQTVENMHDLLTHPRVRQEGGLTTIDGRDKALLQALQLVFLNLGILAHFAWSGETGTLSVPADTVSWLRQTATLEVAPHSIIHWEPIVSLECASAEVFNLTVPGAKSYIANGFINRDIY